MSRFQVERSIDIPRQTFEFTAGYAIPEASSFIPSGLSEWSLPASNALRVEHVGSYEHLGNAWSAANQIARYRKLKQCKLGTFEIYRNSPRETPESELRTDVYLPLRS